MEVEIGGAALADDETGLIELGRIVRELAAGIDNGRLMEAGDEVPLRDYNGNAVGLARLAPDWAAGDLVWTTTPEGSLLPSTVMWVEPVYSDLTRVAARYDVTHEPLTPVLVDRDGRDAQGRPLLGRRRP